MFITANEARERLANLEKKFEEGRIRQVHEWQIGLARKHANIRWWEDDSTSQDWGNEMGGYQSPDYPSGYEPV